MIIGISGKPGTGKDTMAKKLEPYGYTRESLGDRIRELTIYATGLSMKELREHPIKDQPLEDFGGRTGRELTIQVGAAFEGVLGYDIWNKMTERIIKQRNLKDIVIPDIRTPIQANWIKDQGGFLVRIDCGTSSEYDIENRLDNYTEWDYITQTSTWFKEPDRVIADIISRINQ